MRKIIILILIVTSTSCCPNLDISKDLHGEYFCMHQYGNEKLQIFVDKTYRHQVFYKRQLIFDNTGKWHLNDKDESNIIFSNWDRQFEPSNSLNVLSRLNSDNQKFEGKGIFKGGSYIISQTGKECHLTIIRNFDDDASNFVKQ